jgi:hypothetical protein
MLASSWSMFCADLLKVTWTQDKEMLDSWSTSTPSPNFFPQLYKMTNETPQTTDQALSLTHIGIPSLGFELPMRTG